SDQRVWAKSRSLRGHRSARSPVLDGRGVAEVGSWVPGGRAGEPGTGLPREGCQPMCAFTWAVPSVIPFEKKETPSAPLRAEAAVRVSVALTFDTLTVGGFLSTMAWLRSRFRMRTRTEGSPLTAAVRPGWAEMRIRNLVRLRVWPFARLTNRSPPEWLMYPASVVASTRPPVIGKP